LLPNSRHDVPHRRLLTEHGPRLLERDRLAAAVLDRGTADLDRLVVAVDLLLLICPRFQPIVHAQNVVLVASVAIVLCNKIMHA
jgi:hypothetical protein